MINTTLFSQNDRRWKNELLGFSTLTIGGYGCAITCVTMLLNSLGYSETPSTVNEKLKKVKGFDGALIKWNYIPKVWDKVKFIWRGYGYDNVKVSWYVYGKRIPVIVKVDMSPAPNIQGHWVLYVGDRYLLDPWDGKGKPTKTYPAIGYTLYDRT